MNLNADNLESMRLPDLWARYAQVVGVESRSPNKTFLIRKIRECTVGAPDAHEPDFDDEVGDPEPLPIPPEDERAAEKDLAVGPAVARQAAEPVAAALAAEHAVMAPVDRGADLRRLPIAELQERYLEVVGRASDSSSAAYLAWKIREVQKGHIAAGPVRRRAAEEPAEMKVLPLRLPGATVDALDAAVERLGFVSRMAFLRAALAGYLEARGETVAAGLFDGGADA